MMNCKAALEQLREPGALAVCGGVTRQPRPPDRSFMLRNGGPTNAAAASRGFSMLIYLRLTKLVFKYNRFNSSC